LIFFLGVIVPQANHVVDIFEAIIDGYLLYAFFTWLVVNMGGKDSNHM
jgi:hypothetical protein